LVDRLAGIVYFFFMENLSTKEVAEKLQVSASTVRRLFDQKKLEGFMTPGGHRRITRKSVERLLDERNPGITFP
jgi:excisionase family DNA binding protein